MSSYRFDFGDGSTPVTSSMSTASHTFTAAGTYTVTLTVTDNRGATASAMLQVVVSPFVRLPTIVLPAVDDVGQACAIATPGSRVFLAWTSARHPGIFFGERINGTLQVEVVDTLGFNTGGLISQHVSMQVEPNGTPHLVYVRENTVVYATKSEATWLRERVDTPSVPLDLSSNNPSIALVDSSPVVLFTTDTTSSTARPAIASRTAANTWTRTVVSLPGFATNYDQPVLGELVIDPSGRHLFPAVGRESSTLNSTYLLVSWTAAATTTAPLPSLPGRTSMALAGSSRLYALGGNGVMDVQLSTPLSASTLRTSLVETFSTTQHAVATDAAGLPRLVVNHGSTLEVVRSAGSPGFWEWLELGPADPGLIDVSVDGVDATRACFVRAGKLMLY